MLSTLVIDNDEKRAAATRTVLEFLGHAPTVRLVNPGDPSPVTRCLDRLSQFDLAVIAPIDETNGLLETFRGIRMARPAVPLVAMATVDTVSACDDEVDDGSVAWVAVPLRLSEFQNALRQVRLQRENRRPDETERNPELFRNLAGNSDAVRRLRTLIMQVADSEATVLLTGESGTGKEVVARKIHYYSGRRHKPFVPVNCGAIPPDLLESELFGHEKGAFTGAINTRRGRFEIAAGGSLFLDEVGDMPMPMQVKLLRVIQEKTFERIGSNLSLTADVRIVAATHSDLQSAINAGRFREDLFYRLNVFPIGVPPLRERVEDLSPLIKDLLQRLRSEKQATVRFTAEALERLQRYRWPGNVRELANLVERLVILYPHGVVDVAALPEPYRQLPAGIESAAPGRAPPEEGGLPLALPADGIDLKSHLRALERELICQALRDTDGVVAHAAGRLRLGRTTLVEKMRKHGIHRPDPGG